MGCVYLKIRYLHGCVGSNPTSGTNIFGHNNRPLSDFRGLLIWSIFWFDSHGIGNCRVGLTPWRWGR